MLSMVQTMTRINMGLMVNAVAFKTVRTVFLSLIAAGFFVTVTGCSDAVNPKEPLTIPAQIDSAEWAANAADEIAYVGQMTALLTETKRVRTDASLTLDAGVVASKLTPLLSKLSAKEIMDMEGIVQSAVRASGHTMDPMKSPSENPDGGVFIRFLFDSHGADINEKIEKLLFSMALYNNAVKILDTATPTARNVDRALALFGATPAFKNSGADKFCAGYAARRDKNDGTGFYTTIRDAFKKARAAAAAGSKYNDEYREAVATIKKTWERSQMATAINYCFATATTLSATTVTDSARATGMHSFSEAIGFLWGWSYVTPTQRIVKDAQLADMLTLMQGPLTGEQTFYRIWQTPAIYLGDVVTVTQRLQTAYGFSDAEMLDFKHNWVSEQARQ